ncbi:MAG: heavy-metal-associated domain-containing protein [Olsenella sp.]|jgi:copper chaperone CopZ|nr:heavy-metal-associated domain-containing protein [Olsenella sp.]MCI1667249.1 heavy-metal-associated domain-containing protein [Olsenella sp.]MCI2126850.1 heavy-metal-associated domain-containing protein [Olsenella sp.]MCI2159566.1 heavy-metal-associated domain-containing protein [Olsenella sp.]
MKPIDVVLIAGVVAILVVAIRRFVGTATGTRDCCSGARKSAGKQFRTRTIEDTDESRYPYQADLEIGGMSCEHCVENVTRALDSVEGTWATVSLAGGRAHVRSKSPIDEDAYRKVIEEAGYRLVGMK